MDEYTNNLHARIDNILTDAYFGAGNAINPIPKPIHSSEQSSFFSNLVWFILGVVIGVFICYIAFYEDDSDKPNKMSNQPDNKELGSRSKKNSLVYLTNDPMSDLDHDGS